MVSARVLVRSRTFTFLEGMESVDTHVYAGYSIPPHYDSMIAKLNGTDVKSHC